MAGSPGFEEEVGLIVERALAEDLGEGDITTESVIPEGVRVKAVIKAKEECVVCGVGVAEMLFHRLDEGIGFKTLVKDGETASIGQAIAEIVGGAKPIFSGERTALNFMQRLSGIATRTRSIVRAAGGKVEILDTRKTTPGLRVLEKYAVRCGGGRNHRSGLFDEILIKDNHIAIVGIGDAVSKAKKRKDRVEVETRNIKEVREALEAGADVIMLDNMPLPQMKKAVGMIGKKALIEVSGGVDEKSVAQIAALGVDWISLGSLTHSVRAIDMSMSAKRF